MVTIINRSTNRRDFSQINLEEPAGYLPLKSNIWSFHLFKMELKRKKEENALKIFKLEWREIKNKMLLKSLDELKEKDRIKRFENLRHASLSTMVAACVAFNWQLKFLNFLNVECWNGGLTQFKRNKCNYTRV